MPETQQHQSSAPWHAKTGDSAKAAQLAAESGLPPAIARVLLCRGIDSAASAQSYLQPTLSDLHSPYLMLGMETAVRRIRAALFACEPILIYGDYDVDGTVATVLLKTAAERVAACMGVSSDVRYHIPHRIRDGYGMQEARIEEAAAEGVRLVISVDTGIRAFAASEQAERLGLDLIVTDHHLPDATLGIPRAVAVLNPNQPSCAYPCKDLCGAGVAFKLAQALLETAAETEEQRKALQEKTLPSFLKLLSIATIADAVPLTGENRAIASIGLRELRQPAQPGLRALMELAGIDTSRPISASDVGFRLGPRINAAGRMDTASDVVDMFLTRDAAVAKSLAEKLHSLNNDRRATEAQALRSIEETLAALAQSEGGLAACLVLDSPEWHRGVIGILASRVVDRTGRPALVLAHEGGQAFGSGRSVPDYHLLDALTSIDGLADERLFTRFGGHAFAVGFSLPSARVHELRLRMEAHARAQELDLSIAEALHCETDLRLSEATPEFFAALAKMEPFGLGNLEPIFLTSGVRLAAPPTVIKERHLRICVEDAESGTRFGGMAWGRRTDWAARSAQGAWVQGDMMDLAFRFRENHHSSFDGWELEVLGIRRSILPDT